MIEFNILTGIKMNTSLLFMILANIRKKLFRMNSKMWQCEGVN